MSPPPESGAFALGRGRLGVLLLHGFTGSPAEVRPLGERLAEAGFRVRAPLLPGHGTRPEELQATTPEDWSRAAETERQRLAGECRRVAVGGLSLGALLALELAVRHPDGVAALVCLSAPVTLSGRLGALLLLYQLPPALWWQPYFPKPADGDEVCDPSRRELHVSYPVLPMRSGRRLLATLRRTAALAPRIRCPAFVAHGRRDRTVLAGGSRRLARRLGSPTVWQLELPRSGHLITLDWEHRRLEAAVVDFLRQVL